MYNPMRAPASQGLSQSDLNPATSHSTMPALDQQALRQMMEQAAAVASAATANISEESPRYVPEVVPRPRVPSMRIPTGRRHSNVNQLPSTLPSEESLDLSVKGGPLPPVKDGVRWQRIQQVADELKKSYEHPNAAQVETETLHHVRAILYMNRTLITQSFVSHVTGVSQGSLSHYVRGLFRGNQVNVDERLARFVEQFAAGELDQYVEEIRLGIRPAARPLYFPTAPTSTAPATQPSHLATEGPISAEKPPVAPPPPPQLQPAPWTQPVSQPAQSSDQLPSTPPNSTVPKDANGQPSPKHDRPRKANSSDVPTEHFAQGVMDLNVSRASLSNVTQPAVSNEELGDAPTDSPNVVHRTRRRRSQRKGVTAEQSQPTFPEDPKDIAELSPEMAMERAFHTLVAAEWSPDFVLAEPLLIPIELSVSLDGFTMHMYTQWDVNERELSPEVAADRLRRARGLPQTFTRPISAQIRRALFDAGVPCAPPPVQGPVENRRLIRFTVHLTDDTNKDEEHVVSDEIEWDLANGTLNSPEQFAHQFCADENIHHRHAIKIAQAIRKKLTLAQAISYGDESTQKAALNMLEDEDPLRFPLSTIRSALIKSVPEDRRARERRDNENFISKHVVLPLFNAVEGEAKRRTELRKRKAAEDAARKAYEDFKRSEEEKEHARERQQEEEMKQANEEALRVYKERNLDFRPYLALVVARGEHPSIWMPPAFDRRKRKQLTFPMVQQGKRTSTSRIDRLPRPPKRRRLRRDSLAIGEEKDDSDVHHDRGSEDDLSKAGQTMNEKDGHGNAQNMTSLTLKLRVRKPVDDWESSSVRTRKRRRR